MITQSICFSNFNTQDVEYQFFQISASDKVRNLYILPTIYYRYFFTAKRYISNSDFFCESRKYFVSVLRTSCLLGMASRLDYNTLIDSSHRPWRTSLVEKRWRLLEKANFLQALYSLSLQLCLYIYFIKTCNLSTFLNIFWFQ